MSIDADTITDRRRMKRRLSLWRIVAIVAVAVALIATSLQSGLFPPSEQIARIRLEGVIVDDPTLADLLRKVRDDKSVKAVILYINSPGGTASAAEAVYENVRGIAEKKPVVAVLGTVAASGGYIAALSADHIVARGNTITGSIGVIFQWTQLQELMGKLGIEMREVKSAPLKAEPNPFTETSPEALKATEALIQSSYRWFLGLVQERRGFDEATTRKLGDGRVYTGFQAMENGLIDEVGGEQAALAWLRKERRIGERLPVRDWTPEEDEFGITDLVGQAMARAALSTMEGLSQKTLHTKRLTLDGLTSLWHPEAR
ncbi:protease-4 [Parvibaculum indicum]|uniref:signal peptide peptidase SppA n=1 Tax=Parvibaculum indicum TaxID=562969 RepID=UPI001421F502|nr:protease-4 [Parvibaculum indicum]